MARTRRKRQKSGPKQVRGIRRVLRRWHRRLRGRYVHLLILVACMSVVITAFILPPDRMIAERLGLRWHFYCFLDNLFGLKCASCTLARSFSACAQGQLQKAFKHDSLGPTIFLYLMLQIPYRLWSLAKAPKRLGRSVTRIHAGYTALIVALIIIDWLLTLGRKVL